MKVVIRDPEVLKTIKPQQVATYLNLPAQIVLPAHAMPTIEEIGEKFKANWQKELAGR